MSADAAIVTGVRMLWEKGHFQDFTIEVEERSFRVHKLIMASVSDYFNAMLTGGMVESVKDTVHVGVVTALAMEKLISYIYKDEIKLTKDTVAEVLDAAVYLQIPAATKVCVDFMVENVDTKNCCSLLSLFRGYSLNDGVKEVKSFITSNIKKVLEDCELACVQYEEFCFLMDNWQKSEIDLYLYVEKWVNAGDENRRAHHKDLLTHIRFCLMSPEELENIRNTKVYKLCPGVWQELVSEAVEYHKLPPHARVLQDSEQSTLRSKPRLLCLYVENGDPRASALNGNKEWASLELSIPEEFGLSKTALCVNNFLIISPYNHGDGNWHLFDPRTLSWLELPLSTIWNQDDSAAVFHHRYLYVLGGSYYEHHFAHDNIERYDFQTNKCSFLTKLPDTRNNHATCAFQDCIYVSGGCHDNMSAKLRKFDCLNLGTLVWDSKAPMQKKAAGHFMCVMKLHGENVIIVVHKHFQFEYYNISTDQWTSFLFTHDDFPHSTYSVTCQCALMANGNTLYFLDDQDNGVWVNKGQCLEITFPEEGTDVSVTSFGHFETDINGLDFNFYTHGAVLPLPEHKLPGLKDITS